MAHFISGAPSAARTLAAGPRIIPLRNKVGFLYGKCDQDVGGSGAAPANPAGTLVCFPTATADSKTPMSAWCDFQASLFG